LFLNFRTGAYGYPLDDATDIALETVRNWLEVEHENVERIIFVVFSEKELQVYQTKMQHYFPHESL
jgi:O-acetyl-ADP-ribose deacetylase